MILLILLIGLLLIILNVKAISKENKNFNDIYTNRKENLDDISIEIGKLRNEFGETIFELQQEILDLKKKLNAYKNVDDKSYNEKNLIKNSEENNLNYEQFESQIEDELLDEDDLEMELESDTERNDSINEDNSDNIYNEINFSNNASKADNEINDLNIVEEKKSSVKYEEINNLLKKGFSVDEISEKLNMGKGEVLLIIELYLK